MENSYNQTRSFKYMLTHLYQYRFQGRQNGSLLIGLIVTMLIFSILGTAMYYTFSTPSLDAVYGNSAQRAYYAAEAGARYAMATYRIKGPTDFYALNGKEITLPGNNVKATITIAANIDPTFIASQYLYIGLARNVAPTLNVGGDLMINSTYADRIPQSYGYFYTDFTQPNKLLRYKKKILADTKDPVFNGTRYFLTLVTGKSLPQSGFSFTDTTRNKIWFPSNQVLITSTGSVPGIFGILNVTRTKVYGWIPSGVSAPGQPVFSGKQTDVDNFSDATKSHIAQGIQNWFPGSNVDYFATTGCTGLNYALRVNNVGQKTEGASYWSATPYNWSTANMDLNSIWLKAGKLLSQDIQIKIKVDKDATAILDINKPTAFLAGIGFKGKNLTGDEVEAYIVAFVVGHKSIPVGSVDPKEDSGINTLLLPPDEVFYPCTYGSGSCTDYCQVGTWQCYSKPAIIIAKRQNSTWQLIAYKIMNNEQGIFAGYDSSHNADNSAPVLKDFSTLTVRSIEAYPLPFNNGTSTFLYNDIVTVKRWVGSVLTPITIFRINGTPLLTSGNWAGGIAAGTLTIANVDTTKSVTSGDELWVEGTKKATAAGNYGAKAHYIRVYYASTDPDGTSAQRSGQPLNRLAINQYREGNPVLCGTANVLNWPVDDISKWKWSSVVAELNDYFTLANGWVAGPTASPTIFNLTTTATEVNEANGNPAEIPGATGNSGVIQVYGPITDSSAATITPSGCAYLFCGTGIFLVTGGKNSNRVYFDDFGLQLENGEVSAADGSFIQPIEF